MKPSQPLCKPRLRTVLMTCLLAVAFPLTALMSTAGVTAAPRFPTDPTAADLALEVPPVKLNPQDADYQDGNRAWQGIAGIEKAANGRLWASWYGGNPAGENEYNWSLLYTSEDDGDTWTGPVVVVDPDTPVRTFDPMLWTDPDGRLWFFWNQSYYRDDGRYGVWAIHTDNPEDANPTWSEPKRLANGIAMNKPIVLSDGTWMLPAVIWKGSGTTEFEDEVDANVYISKDKGETWSYQGSVRHYAAEKVNPETYQVSEHMVTEQKDGSLRMLIRSDIGIEESYSTDGGKTWSDAVDAGITKVNSRFYYGRLSSGNLLLVYNDPPQNGTARTHLTAAISTDDGKTWPYKLVLDERNIVAYPDAVEDEEGNIYIIYDKGRWAEGEILMAVVTEEDIMAGALTGNNSRLKVMVNNNTKIEDPDPPLAENAWITFDSGCTWTSNPKWFVVTPSDAGLGVRIVQAGAGPTSGAGFAQRLTTDGKAADGSNEAQAIRFYIKNPGEATTVRVQFRDTQKNIWHSIPISIAGGSDRFVAYDAMLDAFTYRWSDAGADAEIVARGTSFKAAREAGKISAAEYDVDVLTFVFSAPTTDDMILKSISAVSLS